MSNITLLFIKAPGTDLMTGDMFVRKTYQENGDQGNVILGEFNLASSPGNERDAIYLVIAALSSVEIPPALLERIRTSVGEAVMNAIEHGNQNQPELTVKIKVMRSIPTGNLLVRVTDHGGNQIADSPPSPNLEAKLSGEQSPRGWGMFLIQHMADEVYSYIDGEQHHLELIFYNPM